LTELVGDILANKPVILHHESNAAFRRGFHEEVPERRETLDNAFWATSFRFALEAMWALVSPLDYGESVPLLQSVASE
jgi:hypothetical protein